MEKLSKKNEDTKNRLLNELKKIYEENTNENDKKDKLIENKKVEENKQSILPKYHFFDFICNLFFYCFKNNKAQKCTSACNIYIICINFNYIFYYIFNFRFIIIIIISYYFS